MSTTAEASTAVLVTRPRDRAAALCDLLAAAGLEALCLPVIETQPVEDLAPLDAALVRGTTYDWIVLSSSTAARLVGRRVTALGVPARAWPADRGRPRLVTSPAGAAELARHGIAAEVVQPFSAAQALQALEGRLHAGQRALLPRGDQGLDTLAHGLWERGVFADEVVVYTTRAARPADEYLPTASELARVGAVTFLSPSAVAGLDAALEGRAADVARLKREAHAACIGPTTATAARAAGWQRVTWPDDTSAPALVRAVAQAVAQERAPAVQAPAVQAPASTPATPAPRARERVAC